MSTVPTLPSASGSRRRLSHGLAFATYAAALIAFLAASSAPTPLYRLYQQHWGLGPGVLTVIFAAYALSLLLALLVAGRLSDHVGRRPVILAALGVQLLAMATFLLAQGPGTLIAARVLQGAATGMATAALGAALLDLGRERGALFNSIAPMLGMAGGALGCTALVVLAPAPLHTVFVVLAASFIVLLALTWRVPETVSHRHGAWASLVPRLRVPVQARAALLAVTPANTAVWMLGGFYLSLMPSLIGASTAVTTPWLGGGVVAALTLSGALAILAARHAPVQRVLLGGVVALGGGLLVILAGANLHSAALLLGGSIVSGVGFGATFLGAIRSVMPLAEPHERSGLMGVFYIESYLANGLPTMAAGYLAQHSSLLLATNVYGTVIVLLVLVALAVQLRGRAGQVAVA